MTDICGREFDWYAIDEEGNIGMFASGGSGQAPRGVIKNHEEYDNIGENMKSLIGAPPTYGWITRS